MFKSACKTIRKTFQFRGRASKREYRNFILTVLGLGSPLVFINPLQPELIAEVQYLVNAYGAVIWGLFYIPLPALFVRRLHDTWFSGEYAFFAIGAFLFLGWIGEQVGENEHGPPPP